MTRDEYIKAKLQVALEVDTDIFTTGYIKGYIEGFKRGSRVEKADGTELCFITKITRKGSEIESTEFCEIIKDGESNAKS